MCLDEKNIQKWEVYTILSNPQKDWIWVILPWTKGSSIAQKINFDIPLSVRERIKEVVTDMSPSMESIVYKCFPNAILTTDRFHVMKMILDDLNAIRMKAKTSLRNKEIIDIKQAKQEKKKYVISRYITWETEVELVTRLKRQLCQRQRDRTRNQISRWKIAQTIPELHETIIWYEYVCKLREIYDEYWTKEDSKWKLMRRIQEWFKHWEKIIEIQNMSNSINNRLESISNYFVRRTTNWYAEWLNSRIQRLISLAKWFKNIDYTIYRIIKLFT